MRVRFDQIIVQIYHSSCLFQSGTETAIEELLEDPEVIAQLDWLWSNKMVNDTRSVVELSQQVDKGCVKEELKPIER